MAQEATRTLPGADVAQGAEFDVTLDVRDKGLFGRVVETLGHYNPRTKPETITVDADKARSWLGKGATPSDTVRSLFKKAGVFDTPAEA